MSRWRIILWPGLTTLVALGILLSLGNWQLRRMHEKEAMLSALDSAITAAPKSLMADSLDINAIEVVSVSAREMTAGGFRELTRVTITGTYIPARSVPVRATLPTSAKGGIAGGIGFFWMTPLRLDNGAIAFINRGFVPSGGNWKAPAIPTPEGPQTITGIIRLPEKAQTFTPPDNPAKGEYFIRDPAVMAKAVGLDKAANFFIDAERIGDNVTPPVGIDAREMIARIPNNHLQYAVTWFAFALTLLGVFGVFARGRIKALEAS
jgi:surfeit locus 1 family protein